MSFWSLLHRVRHTPGLLAAVLVVDAAAMLFGWYYYWDVGQFNPASSHYEHWAWWPLVADSPNAVLLFFIAALSYRLTGWRNKWLDAAAVVLNIYVGLWTSYLFIVYAETMGTWDWGGTNNILFFSHLGMPLQALLLVGGMKHDTWNGRELATLVAVAAVYIGVDYWGPMLHPAPFLHPADRLLHLGSPWLMIVAIGAWWLLRRSAPTSGGQPETNSP